MNIIYYLYAALIRGRLLFPLTHDHCGVYSRALIYSKCGAYSRKCGTVQEEILAREIFGEIARLKHLANFTLTNDIWMY